MKFKQALKTIQFGKPQNVGNMVVIPLISNTEHTDVSEDMLFHISKDSDYAHLTLSNPEDRPSIVPQGATYITKQSAQDRTVLSANVIKPKKEKIVNVGCVESGQGGYISEGTEEFTFVPPTIRAVAMEKDSEDHDNYEILWKDIEKYMKKIGMKGIRAHISDFYRQFKKELDEFVASFEPVDKQVGAVILINNQVRGIEIYPNYKSWKKVWRGLIRDCYGAEALAFIKKERVVGYKPIINIDKINSLKDLEIETGKVIIKHLEFVREKVDPIINEELESETVNEVDDFTIDSIRIKDLVGQAIKKGDNLIYITAIKGMI